jgi:iron complex outermembrane recepter protein
MTKARANAGHRRLLMGTSATTLAVCGALGFASPAAAQSQPAAPDTASTAPGEDIVVTGSRIARPALDLPTPVSVIGADTLRANDAQFDIGRALAQQPAIGFSGAMQQNQQSGAAGTRGETSGGLSLADLRSLGANRTLVLVNGKRRVAGTTDSAAVDLNSIDPAMIQRIEVITGGASAIYGSDAVSGVVNIITRDTFNGLNVSLSGSRPTESNEGLTFGGSLIAGKNFADGRGNITVGGNYTKVKEITPLHADMSNYIPVLNPANTSTTDGIPDRILVANGASYRFAGSGAVGVRNDTGGLGQFVFNEDGTARPAPTALFTDGSLFGVFNNCGARCFQYDDTISIVPDIERYNLHASGHFEVSSAATLYFSADYNNTTSFGRGQPVQQSAVPINIAQNAYLNPAFRQQLLTARATTLQLDRSFFDLGLRSSRVERNSLSLVGGIRGTIETAVSDLKYDVYVSYGRTNATFTGYNRLITSNFRAAVDAVVDPADGIIKCRMNVPTLQPTGYVRPVLVGSSPCVPYNLFGATASSQAARDFVRATTVATAFVRQTVTGASLSGDSSKFLTLPGGGTVGIAIGAEYRKESNGRVNDPLIRQGLLTQASSQDFTGGFDVSEVFGEVNVPLLTDLPFARLLSIEAAVRRADYSQSGGATAWKAGAIWEPVDGLRFRGTVSRAVRAPNIFEAFRPTEGQNQNITDPCAQLNLALNPNRTTNCAALGRPSGFTPINGGLGINFVVSGNPKLTPEKSDSWTAGVTLSPKFIPGLQITADWFNIDIQDAVSFLTGQQIANNCVDRAGGPDPALCALITRETNTASANLFAITSGRSTYVNTSRLETSGLDTQLFYASALGRGRISTTLSLTYLYRLRSFTFQARPDLYTVLDGFLGFPRIKAIAAIDYTIGGFRFGWQGRYQSSQSLIDRSPGLSLEIASPSETGARFYNDVSGSYRFALAGKQEAIFSLGVTNLLNVRLPVMASTQAISTTAGGFDQFGPVVRARLEVTF